MNAPLQHSRWIVALLLLSAFIILFVVIPYIQKRVAIQRCRRLVDKIFTADPINGDAGVLDTFTLLNSHAEKYGIRNHHLRIASMFSVAHWAYLNFCLYIRYWKKQHGQNLHLKGKQEMMDFSIMLWSLRVQADVFSRRWLKRPHDEMVE